MKQTKKSFCRFCHVFCGVEVDLEDGHIVKVRGDADNAVSGGYTCLKGRAEPERIYHPDRLTSSKKMVGGEHVDIAAETAMDEVAERLRAIIDEHGPESVAVYLGDACHRMSATGPWFIRKWLDALGSPKMYTSYTIDSPSLTVSNYRLFGAPMPFAVFDVSNADVAMFVATNPVISHMMSIPQSNPAKRMRDARKRGMKLIVVDPRRCEAARDADIHLQVKPGEDATLLAAIIKVILDRELHDREYVDAYVGGVAELHEAVRPFDLEYAAKRTEVPAKLIEEAAVMFASAKSGAVQSGTGLHMARHQNLTTQLVMTINALCGRYDRRGGLTRHDGVLNRPLPENPGPIPLRMHPGPESRVRGIKAISNWLGMLEMPTNTLTDEILEPGKGQIKALIVNGGNPALVLADEAATIKALKEVDLLVVTELFMSATARHADYVFAAKHPFERADVPRLMDATFPFPFSQYTEALVDAPEGMIEEWEMFWGLAKRLGFDLRLRGIDMENKPTTDQMLDALHTGSRIPLDEVRKYPGGHVWGDRETLVGGVIPNMIGHADKKIAAGHPEVIAELKDVLAEPSLAGGEYRSSEKFDFRMITYRMRDVYCTQGQNLPSLTKKRTYNPVLMNPASMRTLGVKTGDLVVVESGFGKIEAVVEESKNVAANVIGLAHGWGDPCDERGVREKGSNVQLLIPDHDDFDPVTGLAQQSAVSVNVYAA